MFGFGFLNGVFLAALAAMALPVIIHILNRRRVKKIRFSSLEFIAELNKRRMSKINLRRWIILLLRTLAVLCLVLAFARPTIRSTAPLFMPGDTPQHIVICLDVSYSMGAEQEKGTAFTAAQALARQVVDECQGNDLLNVVAFSTRADVAFEAGTRNKQVIKNAIDELDVSGEGTSTRGAVEAAADLIARSDVATGEIYVISDFREPGDSLCAVDLPENTRLIILPVYREAIDNVSIDQVFTPRKLIRPGEVVRVGVAVTNHSHERPVAFPLELFIGGKRKAEKIVSLSPASSATVTFIASMNKRGSYRCRVAKTRDRLPIDDDRFFVMDVSAEVPVTLIRGRKYAEDGDTEPTAAYFFVDKALNPRGSSEGEFSIDLIDQNDLTVASLPSRGVVVWTDPQRMDARRFDLLKRHIHRGGSMVVFLGSDRGAFWRDGAFSRYLGIQNASVKANGASADAVGFASFAGAHPIFAIFNKEELELFSRSRTRRHVSAALVSADSILAYLDSGDPGIWECRRGQGRIIVFAAAPDLSSGDLPLSPMFLPVVHTTVSYLAGAGGGGSRRENIVGYDLFFDLPAKWRAQTAGLRVRTESAGDTHPLLFETKQGETTAMLTRPREVGFYALLSDSTWIADACVNVDTQESNLNARTLDETAIEGSTLVDASGDFADNLRRARQGREIYALFLLLAASMLVGEALLGRKA